MEGCRMRGGANGTSAPGMVDCAPVPPPSGPSISDGSHLPTAGIPARAAEAPDSRSALSRRVAAEDGAMPAYTAAGPGAGPLPGSGPSSRCPFCGHAEWYE